MLVPVYPAPRACGSAGERTGGALGLAGSSVSSHRSISSVSLMNFADSTMQHVSISDRDVHRNAVESSFYRRDLDVLQPWVRQNLTVL
jgi:hypothetical protein